MTQLDDLYKEIILDHYRRPRSKGALPVPPAHRGHGFNPLCGDEVTVDVLVEDGRVTDVMFEGRGCAISQASASMMCELVSGKTVEAVAADFDLFRSMLGVDVGATGSEAAFEAGGEPGRQLGDAESLQGVREFPSRIKCATLSWNTLTGALAGEDEFTETDT
ncbi:MAG: SUF system NifU family Fe-S cluster assembly protein [Acidimicrobiia bacterium]|nr:SUF system NifU family Fe-S cluster assembly protein [Acidimicrobiia bacterium]